MLLCHYFVISIIILTFAVAKIALIIELRNKKDKIMAKVYEFLANGFEEIEGLAPVDILRRGGVDIKTVSITGTEW